MDRNAIAGHRATVLVVDDTYANIRLLNRILSENGYAVRAANSSESAANFMQNTVPDIVLLDVKMPGMDGYELCRWMKHNESLQDVPVLFVSAMSAPWEKVKAFAVGGVDYIVKPVEEAEVLARVETHLSLHKFRMQLEQQVEARTAELLATKSALYEKKQLLQSIIDSSAAVIYIKDIDGAYMLVNKRFQKLFGDQKKDLRGLTDYEIFPRDIADSLFEFDQKVIINGSAIEVEETMPHGGERRTFASVKSPLYDLNGKMYAICGIATDITERVREETTLRTLNNMLEKRLLDRQQNCQDGESIFLSFNSVLS